MRKLIRANGDVVELSSPMKIGDIRSKIDADTLDTVQLADGVHVMLVDDIGHFKELPINQAATQLYWDRCGGPVEHVIVGDVVVVPDSDFA